MCGLDFPSLSRIAVCVSRTSIIEEHENPLAAHEERLGDLQKVGAVLWGLWILILGWIGFDKV